MCDLHGFPSNLKFSQQPPPPPFHSLPAPALNIEHGIISKNDWTPYNEEYRQIDVCRSKISFEEIRVVCVASAEECNVFDEKESTEVSQAERLKR